MLYVFHFGTWPRYALASFRVRSVRHSVFPCTRNVYIQPMLAHLEYFSQQAIAYTAARYHRHAQHRVKLFFYKKTHVHPRPREKGRSHYSQKQRDNHTRSSLTQSCSRLAPLLRRRCDASRPTHSYPRSATPATRLLALNAPFESIFSLTPMQ